MKVLKLLFRAIAVLTVLAVAAVVVVTTLFDPNEYKPQIEALAKEHTGRTLRLHGDIELAFFPWLGVKVARVELSENERFANASTPEPMLSAEQVAVKVKLIPLLHKRVEVAGVRLDAPRIRLIRNADGSTNWDDLAEKARRAGGFSTQQKSPPDAVLLAGLAVHGISIVDGEVDWDDRAAGRSLNLRALRLSTSTFVAGEPLEVNASVEAAGSMLPERVTLALTTTAQLATDFASLSLRGSEIDVDTQSIAADFSIKEIVYELPAQLIELAELHGIAKREGIDSRLQIPAIHFDWSNQSVQIPRLDLEQDGFFLSASASGDGVLSGVSALAVNGNINARIEDVRELLKRNKSPVPLPPDLVNAMDVGVQFEVANRNLVLNDLTVVSLEKPDGEILFLRKKLVIPLNKNGIPASGALAYLLWSGTESKFNQWLLRKIDPTDDPKPNEAGNAAFRKTLKEKLGKLLDKSGGGE